MGAQQVGTWTYGANHAPNNWGAYSEYYHPSRWHWSDVSSSSDYDYRAAGARYTSRSFINTYVEEVADFGFGS